MLAFGACLFLFTIAMHESVLIKRTTSPTLILTFVVSRNYTMPPDLVHLIIESWILRPSQMNMNELIEKRDSVRCLWAYDCALEIDRTLTRCNKNSSHMISFIPSNAIFVFLLNWGHGNTAFHVVVCLRNGKLSPCNFSYRTKGPRFTIMFTEKDILFGSSYHNLCKFPRRDTGRTIGISWTTYGCTVREVIKYKRASNAVNMHLCTLLGNYLDATNLTNADFAVLPGSEQMSESTRATPHPTFNVLRKGNMNCVVL